MVTSKLKYTEYIPITTDKQYIKSLEQEVEYFKEKLNKENKLNEISIWIYSIVCLIAGIVIGLKIGG